jgi:hypothetical protein
MVESHQVAKMVPAEQPAVIAALARAFYDDPLFSFFLPQRVRQSRALLVFMGSGIKDTRRFDEVWVAHRNGSVAATAAWLPPGAYPRTVWREVLTYSPAIPTFAATGRRIPAALRLFGELDKVHHKHMQEPHWYLVLLGTDPSFQRGGAASAALEPVLTRCDAEGIPAYLETQKKDNLAYYARHRFEVVQQLDVRGCPPLWALRRDPH